MAPLEVGGIVVPPGSAQEIRLKISEFPSSQPVTIPVTVLRGERPGPVVCLTAAVHGNEINGTAVVLDLLDELRPAGLSGAVIAVPIVNRLAFLARHRGLADGRDLNRHFPGNAAGSAASRIALVVFEGVVRKADYAIDLHTGGVGRTNLVQVRGDLSIPAVRRLARIFGTEVIVDHPGAAGSLRRAATEAGIPTLLVEAGEIGRFQRQVVETCKNGVRNVLRGLGVLEGPPGEPRFRLVVRRSSWVRADRGGMLDVAVRPGRVVEKGEPLASIINPFGREVSRLLAPGAGLVIGTTLNPLVSPGDPVAHLARRGAGWNAMTPHIRQLADRTRTILPRRA